MTHKDKLLPNFCYSKLFWIFLPISIGVFSSVFGALYAEVNGLEESIHEIDLQVAENNVPELKDQIDKHFANQDNKMDRLQITANENYRLLCKLTAGEC